MNHMTTKTTKRSLKDELRMDVKLPFWAFLGLLIGAICLAYGGGMLNREDPDSMAYAVVAFGGASYLGVLVTGFVLGRKKRAALKPDTAAVSPVIGVILMVAITVVLAAVVFVLVSKLGSDTGEPVALWMASESATDTTAKFSVTGFDGSSLEWSDFTFRDQAGDSRAFTVNGGGDPDATVQAGDVVTFTGLTPGTSYTLRAVYEEAVVWQGHVETDPS